MRPILLMGLLAAVGCGDGDIASTGKGISFASAGVNPMVSIPIS
jgi:hypothetical protein